jgi:hypothetical protein
MSKQVKIPPVVKGSARLKAGKGWRLVNPKRTSSMKAALVAAYTSSGQRFVVFRVRD